MSLSRSPFVLLGFSLLALTVGVSCKTATPKAARGAMDLSSWDFQKNPEVNLDGEWEYWWGRLYTPTELDSAPPGQSFKIPGCWNAEKDKPAVGMATFRLSLNLPGTMTQWSLMLPDIACAYSLFINGKLLYQLGVPSNDPSLYRAEVRPRIVSFTTSGPVVDLVFDVVNRSDVLGGIRNHIFLGPTKALEALHNRSAFGEAVLLGALLALGAVHLFVFLFQHNKPENLWLSLFSLCITWRGLSTGDRIIQSFFHGVTFDFWSKSEFLAVFLGVIFVSLYLRSLYRAFWPERAMKLFGLFTLVFIALLFPLSLANFAQIFSFYEAPLLGALVVFFVVPLRAARHHVQGAWIVVSGICILTAGAVNDLLYLNDLIRTGFLLDKFLFVFMVMQSFLLSRQMASDFHKTEVQAQELRTIDKLKDEFLARVSHELRTPLHGILGITEAFQRHEIETLSPNQLYHMGLLESSSKRLLAMVNSILDFSTLKNHQRELNLQPIDLKQAVDFLFPLLKPQLHPGVQLHNRISALLPPALGEATFVQQTLQELLSNAVTHTFSGSIAVEAEIRGTSLLIHVRDTGEGISAEKQPRLFEPFHQTEDIDTRRTPGLGLGLAVCKEMVEQMHGTVSFISAQGRGTTVSFSLPICAQPRVQFFRNQGSKTPKQPAQLFQATPPQLAEEHPGEHPGNQEKTILIVDDEPINLLLLKKFLTSLHYNVLSAQNGETALSVLESSPLSLVILDVMMPGLSGFEVCTRIRKKFSPHDLPVILLTAKNTSEDLKKGFESGANDFITKPFDREEIRARLEFHLKMTGQLTGS
ncbi:MAG: response regulator [Spirochaetales bacterium]|nr:response regulator [Spirochaetales bacterium]